MTVNKRAQGAGGYEYTPATTLLSDWDGVRSYQRGITLRGAPEDKHGDMLSVLSRVMR